MNDLTTPAVPSGRSVIDEPSLSVNVYISFSTISVVVPILLAKISVNSTTGSLISEKPYRSKVFLAFSSMNCHLFIFSGKMSLKPLIDLTFMIAWILSH